MLQRNSRPAKVLGALLLGGLSLIICTVLAWGALLPFSTGPFGVLPVSRDPITFPPRDPCTPVPDPLKPPVYPNAQNVVITQDPNHRWLERGIPSRSTRPTTLIPCFTTIAKRWSRTGGPSNLSCQSICKRPGHQNTTPWTAKWQICPTSWMLRGMQPSATPPQRTRSA